MVKNIIHIEGMSCGMCEAHIADTIRHAFPHAAHVSASRSKKEAAVMTPAANPVSARFTFSLSPFFRKKTKQAPRLVPIKGMMTPQKTEPFMA